jgi:hypothetical protein
MRMNDDGFENRLEALFDTPPTFDDNPAFALAVQRRLARAARWRADLSTAAWAAVAAAGLWAMWIVADVLHLTDLAVQSMTTAGLDGDGWLLPVLAVAAVLGFQLFEDRWAQD